mgnify:CR=1 FL=1|jgi:Chromosome segregation ATPases
MSDFKSFHPSFPIFNSNNNKIISNKRFEEAIESFKFEEEEKVPGYKNSNPYSLYYEETIIVSNIHYDLLLINYRNNNGIVSFLETEPNVYEAYDNTCGLISIYVILRHLGISHSEIPYKKMVLSCPKGKENEMRFDKDLVKAFDIAKREIKKLANYTLEIVKKDKISLISDPKNKIIISHAGSTDNGHFCPVIYINKKSEIKNNHSKQIQVPPKLPIDLPVTMSLKERIEKINGIANNGSTSVVIKADSNKINNIKKKLEDAKIKSQNNGNFGDELAKKVKNYGKDKEVNKTLGEKKENSRLSTIIFEGKKISEKIKSLKEEEKLKDLQEEEKKIEEKRLEKIRRKEKLIQEDFDLALKIFQEEEGHQTKTQEEIKRLQEEDKKREAKKKEEEVLARKVKEEKNKRIAKIREEFDKYHAKELGETERRYQEKIENKLRLEKICKEIKSLTSEISVLEENINFNIEIILAIRNPSKEKKLDDLIKEKIEKEERLDSLIAEKIVLEEEITEEESRKGELFGNNYIYM